MAIAAVPDYLLRQDLSSASPGMRFGTYLQLWGTNNRTGDRLWTTHDLNYRRAGKDNEEREFRDENKTAALRQATRLTDADKKTLSALAQRQSALAAPLQAGGQLLRIEALAIAPFATGLGNEHPLENGFAFLSPYGLPYLPASGVKGVLRQAARELAGGDWGDTHGWATDQGYAVSVGKRRIPLSMLDVLFGKEGRDGETDHVRGALTFWDVYPQLKGDSLQVEIMTAHQSHYYQNGETPHESGSPNPINFLTVPPRSGFAFHVQCDLPFLAMLSPDLAQDGRWQVLLQAAFTHAFDWLGFGAKTAVGYGQLAEDMEARAARAAAERAAKAQADREAELAKKSPADRSVAEALDEKREPDLPDAVFLIQLLEQGRWQGVEAKAVAEIVRTMLRAEKKWKESSKKPDKDKDYKRTLAVLKVLGEG